MLKIIFTLLILSLILGAFEIKQTPIPFGNERVALTKEYIKTHYGLVVKDITIVPKIILIHYTAIGSFEESLGRFTSQTLPSVRAEIAQGGAVNVSTHFMIERDGTIHQLMPLNWMGRHVIGLNYNSIGIENVGGQNRQENLTKEQLASNIFLVNYLRQKFDTIEYVVGHHEYQCFKKTPLWLEKDNNYFTQKEDPGAIFMKDLRANIKGFKEAPCD
ncbi:MAG: peptidoglycan recognition family protein [Sulfurimonas sp.]|jgi:beta-N-acetylhexosaminidase